MSRNAHLRKTPMSVAIAGIGALAILLTSCGGATVEQSTAEKEQEFLFFAHQERSLEAIDDETLINLGWDLCYELRDGRSATSILDEASMVFTSEEGRRGFASVLAAAVTVLCRDQAGVIDSQG